MLSRRAFLTASGVTTVALAGCAGWRERSAETNTTTPTGTVAATRDLAVGEAGLQGITLTDARVQSSVRHVQSTDYNGVMADEAWYVFVTVETSVDCPGATEFRLRTANGEYEPLAADGDCRRRQIDYVEGEAYRPDEEADGWLLFTVPYDDGTNARLALGRTTWTLRELHRERLRAEPPAFTLTVVKTPAEPRHDRPFGARLTVANDGGDGTFRGAFNYTAPLYYPQGFSSAVLDGETTVLDIGGDIHQSLGDPEPGEAVEARVVSAGGDGEWSVTLA
jgi:hypothetical protein